MRRGREDGRHEWLFHAAHGQRIVLQELLVPDGPSAVKVIVTVEPWVFVILRPSVILAEARCLGKGLKAHGTVLRTMEEACGVAFVLAQLTCQS